MTSLYSLILLLVSVVSVIEDTTAFCSQQNTRNNLKCHENQRRLFMKLEYRNAKVSDINSISELCSETFDGPFQWHQQIQKLQSIENFKVQLRDRLNNLVAKGIKHGMIVAVDSELPEKNNVVGFVEIGLLPSPNLGEAIVTRDTEGEEGGEEGEEGKEEGGGGECETGNTATVDNTVSTASLTSKVSVNGDIKVNNRVTENFTVVDNSATQNAQNIVEVNTEENVEIVENVMKVEGLEGLESVTKVEEVWNVDSPYGSADPNELVLAAAALEAEQKRAKKREEVPYLGNVAVSVNNR